MNEPDELPEDDIMNQVTLPYRQNIHKSDPDGLRSNTPSLGHGASKKSTGG